LRGNGNSSVRAGRASDFGYKELVEYDLPAAIECLKSKCPDKKIVLLGHSLGGQVSVLYLRQNLHGVSGLVLVASCSVYYKGWPKPTRWFMLAFSQFVKPLVSIVGYFPGRTIGFAATEARTVMTDWANIARNGDYTLKNSQVDYSSEVVEVDIPVLAINLADDSFAPHKATTYLLSKLNSKTVKREIISAEQLGAQRADHFNWLKHPASINERCCVWIKTTILKL